MLTVRDAMEQVRDFFALAETDASVAWKLVSATTNSPFDVTGELVAIDQGLPPEELAAHAMAATRELSSGIAALKEGEIIEDWRSGPKSEILKRILKRNTNGVGASRVFVNDAVRPEVVTPTVASSGLAALQKDPEISRARSEMGSIDGDYLQLGSHWAKPAIRIRERKTGRSIWCIVSEADFERFDAQVHASDVWRHKRVRARGKIVFNSSGAIDRVETTEVELLPNLRVSLDDVRDPSFTGGLSVSEYLMRFREGDIERN